MAQQPRQPHRALGVALELIISLAGCRAPPARCEGLLFGGLISFAGLRAPFRAAPCARAVCVCGVSAQFQRMSICVTFFLFVLLCYYSNSSEKAGERERERNGVKMGEIETITTARTVPLMGHIIFIFCNKLTAYHQLSSGSLCCAKLP